MATIKLVSIDKEIELKPFTRKISREMSEALLENVIVKDAGTMDIPAINTDRAQEVAIKLLTGLSQLEIDDLANSDYQLLKDALNDLKESKKKEI